MTIPTRPAPAPPGPRGLNAAAGANASLEQLRMQFQEQQQHHHHHHQSYQQQNGGVQKLTIKLPPPPNSRHNGAATPLANLGMQQKNYNNNNSNSNQNNYNANNNDGTNGSSITRKFPQANVRYAPTTSWDGLPFEPTASSVNSVTTNSGGNGFKKVPPPRPPPPKVQFSSKKTTAPAPPQSVNILNNIFNRKKSVKAPAPSSAKDGGGRRTPAGVYGTSSGNYGTTIATSTTATTHINNSSYGAFSSNSWGGSSTAAFSSYSSSTTTTTSLTQQQEAQLISFDSPPSSPTFTQKSNSDCVSVDSFSSDSNFSSPHNGSVSQPESGFEDDFTARSRSTTSPLDPWETLNAFSNTNDAYGYASTATIGTAPVRNLSSINTRIQGSNDNPLCNGKSLLPPAPSVTAPTIIKPKISQKPKAPKPPVLKQNFQNSNTAAAAFGSDDLPTPPSPPMPQCAPPPPPPTLSAGGGSAQISLLDVITGKVDALQLAQSTSYELEQSEPPYGYALYDFDGVEDGDLSFRENEKIYLLEQVSDEWYRGRTRNGCEGIFPSNYIDIRIPLAVPSQKNTTTTTISPAIHTAHNTTANAYEIPKVRCLYNFPAEVAGDLALRENDMVTILYKINEDWLYGRIDGREGQFPANFLEYIPAHIPMP